MALKSICLPNSCLQLTVCCLNCVIPLSQIPFNELLERIVVEDGRVETCAVHTQKILISERQNSEKTEVYRFSSPLTMCGIPNLWSTIHQFLMHHTDGRASQMHISSACSEDHVITFMLKSSWLTSCSLVLKNQSIKKFSRSGLGAIAVVKGFKDNDNKTCQERNGVQHN